MPLSCVAVSATSSSALSTTIRPFSLIHTLEQLDDIMLSRDDAQPLYITGGQGGPGGQGYRHGTGGPGGAGLGPTVHITAHNLHATFASEQAFQLSNIRAQRVNHCPPPSRIFHGRQDILDEMHRFFTSNMKIQHIYVLHGLGGAGKTQIALKFINESSSHFSDIFLIDTSTIMTIETGLKNIAVVKDFGDSPQDGLLWLTSKVEEWLLFFDNADDPSMDLNNFIPQCNHGNIIITSRNPGLCVYAGSHSLVSDMEEEDAVALLLKSAAQEVTTCTEQIATEIVKALHYLPLAIVQAGAFISKSQDLDSYLTLYTKNQAQLLSQKPVQSHDRYAWTVYTTWQMSFNQLKPLAATFLQLCSFLYHKGISEEIFSYASEYTFLSSGPSKKELQEPWEFLSHFLGPTGEWDSLQFLHVTNEIKAYSLISFDAEKKLFSIHPLVHAWRQATVHNPETYKSTMGSILGMAISGHTQQSIQLAGTIWPDIWNNGKYGQAEKLLEEVLEKQKQLLGENHPDTLDTMGYLANTYSDLGEHQKAGELKGIVLEKQKQLLGENHPDTLRTMGNLAITYSDLGEHQKAGELRKQLLGENHPDTLIPWVIWPHILTWESIKKQENSGNSFWVKIIQHLRTMGNLATHTHLGEHQKAGELKGIVLEKQKQLLGENHPATLVPWTWESIKKQENSRVLCWRNRNSFWVKIIQPPWYHGPGRASKSRRTQAIVLEKQKQLLGENHPDTLVPWVIWPHILNLGEHQKAGELK
ncbi:P-loop containing nucleoside triphosphate hydrolase protein, partial [Mycena leptocephala]